jgi:hypothetical protein
MDIVRIDRRFCGPPDSGNGGYFAGLTAAPLGGSDVVVTLRAPAPLDIDLRRESDGERAALFDGERLLAEAAPLAVTGSVPVPPSLDAALAAEHHFVAATHVYPGCFVCGPDRAADDGWRIFAGPFARERVAAVWTPPSDCAGDDGHVARPFLWAALDCPGYFAVQDRAQLALLGRIAVRIHDDVRPGEPLIVQAWGAGSEGRKHRAGTALHRADGSLVAQSDQLWVTLSR